MLGLMPGNPLLQTPFMPVEYERVIEPLDRLVEVNPTDMNERNTRQQMMGSAIRVARSNGFVRQEMARLPDTFESDENLEQLLQLDCLGSVTRDRTLQFIVQSLAIMSGEAQAEGETDAAERARDLGDQAILTRARTNVTHLLAGSLIMLGASDEPAASDSIWRRTLDAHKKKRLPSPSISRNNWVETRHLADQAGEQDINGPELPIKIGSSRILNAVRFVRYMRKQSKAISGSSFDELASLMSSMVDLHSAGGRIPLELDEQTLTRALSTLSKTMKHVRNAADIDPSIASEVPARYMAYLLPELSAGCAVKTERKAFDRISGQFA